MPDTAESVLFKSVQMLTAPRAPSNAATVTICFFALDPPVGHVSCHTHDVLPLRLGFMISMSSCEPTMPGHA